MIVANLDCFGRSDMHPWASGFSAPVHAEAQIVQKPCFRTLSDQGASKQFAIAEIISSPMARCVETALRFSDAVKDITATSEVRVRDRLKEQRAGQLSAGDLVSVLDETISQAVLICTHGDLAGALPINATLDAKYNDKGWSQSVRFS